MRIIILLTAFQLFFLSCGNNKNEIKIEKFVLLQHNQNSIKHQFDFEARLYIEYMDSCNKVRLAKTDIDAKHSDYFIARAPDSLRNYIFKNLYHKNLPPNFKNTDGSYINDGDYYCIVYKFSNDKEKTLFYTQHFTIPDTLIGFIKYVENLENLYTYTKTDSFDRTSLTNKHRDLLIKLAPEYPPLVPPGMHVKFSPPKIKPIED